MTEEHGVPDHRCGVELDRRRFIIGGSYELMGDICCWRKTWRDTSRCIWHAKIKNKPVEALKAARANGPERLDGAYLVGVKAGNELSFRGCVLRSAIFSGGEFSRTQFHKTDFIRAKFHNTAFTRAEFHDAILNDAEFHNAALSNAKFHETDLTRAEFHNAALSSVEFHDVNLSDAEFHGADLHDADCTDAVARRTDFTYAILHDTVLTRADCRGATFTSALLYETVLTDTRINSQTTFYDPEATFYDSITFRPAVVYEENPLTSEDLPGDIHPLKAAEWVYRRLEKLHEENALSEDARYFHISKEEAQRKYQWESGEYIRSAVSKLQWHVTGHGESIRRIFGSAAILILICGGLYPFAGGFESSSTGAAYRFHLPPTEFSRTAILDGIATFLQSIYFSVITFTTIGYGDLYPTGAWSKVLVGFESLSGAILIALFVFVLGRRVAR